MTYILLCNPKFFSFKIIYRLRIPLKSAKSTTVGFLTINVWNLEVEGKGSSTESTPSRNVPSITNQVYCHRRSQSLPPKLGTKIKLPHQGQLKLLFANPFIQSYRCAEINMHLLIVHYKIFQY